MNCPDPQFCPARHRAHDGLPGQCVRAVLAILPARFWAKVTTDSESGCWIWVAANRKGYGHFKWQGRTREAHRVAYEVLVGPVPLGLHLDHLCRNPPCVNPDHLEPVTQAENNRRKEEALGIGRYATHCAKGHEFTPDNTYWSPQVQRRCRACDVVRHRRAYLRRKARISAERATSTERARGERVGGR